MEQIAFKMHLQPGQIDAYTEFGLWCWQPYYLEGPFDFGDPTRIASAEHHR